jgi:hypothetical protein
MLHRACLCICSKRTIVGCNIVSLRDSFTAVTSETSTKQLL